MDMSERLIRLDELNVILSRVADSDAIACIQARRREILDAEAMTAQFQSHMRDICETAGRDYHCADEAFVQLMDAEGGLAAAKQVINRSGGGELFARLCECGRLDLTVEAQALLPQYEALFTPEERGLCRARLVEHGYSPETGIDVGKYPMKMLELVHRQD